MKRYLLSLGALVVGTGLVFLIHGKVAAQMVKKPSGGANVEGLGPKGNMPEGKPSLEIEEYGFMFPLDPFIVNLAGSRGSKFLKVNVSLKMSAPEVNLELRKNILKLTDSILFLLTSKSIEDVDSFQEKSELEDEIMVRINKFLTIGQVRGVYFTEFIIQ